MRLKPCTMCQVYPSLSKSRMRLQNATETTFARSLSSSLVHSSKTKGLSGSVSLCCNARAKFARYLQMGLIWIGMTTESEKSTLETRTIPEVVERNGKKFRHQGQPSEELTSCKPGPFPNRQHFVWLAP